MFAHDIAVELVTANPLTFECDGLIAFVFRDEPSKLLVLGRLPRGLAGVLRELCDDGEVTGAAQETTIIHALSRSFRRLVVVGLGSARGFGSHDLRLSLAEGLRRCRAIGLGRVAVAPPEAVGDVSETLVGRAVGEAIPQSLYRFEKYLQKPISNPLTRISVVVAKTRLESFAPALSWGESLGEGIRVARNIANEPANVLTPERFAREAVNVAKLCGLKSRVLAVKDLERLGMNLILAVGKGSIQEPRAIVLEHKPRGCKGPLVALLGKGITYDSGGISLKQRKETMFGMKRDMIGGSIVLGLMQAAARVKLDLHLVAVIPSAENMPGPEALKPGDVVRSMSGRHIEILNTDAEGRLVLADAFTYVQEHHKPSILIDIATITGSPRVFGPDLIPVFANDDALFARLEQASVLAGENVWRMPLHRRYRKGIRSYFADLKNVSTSDPKFLKSALFLEAFVEEGLSWVHIDIGGGQHYVSNKETGIFGRGATAKGMALLAYLLDDLARMAGQARRR